MIGPHPSECQLHDLLDDVLEDKELSAVQLHVQGCAECQLALTSARKLLLELKSLPTEAQRIPATWIAPKPYWALTFLLRYPAIATATTMVIFVAGICVGAWMGPFSSAVPVHSRNDESESLAEDVQHWGTQYVTAIANWRREEPSGPDAEQGREAALAALYGAAYELHKLRPEDPQLRSVVRSIADLRNEGLKQNPNVRKEN